LPDKTRKCSLELFHLLKVLVNEKSKIDQQENVNEKTEEQ
jgi:hypothetical protein